MINQRVLLLFRAIVDVLLIAALAALIALIGARTTSREAATIRTVPK